MNNRYLFSVVILLAFTIGLTCTTTVYSAQKKAMKDIPVSTFSTETQKSIGTDADSFNLTWIIPVEFWEVSLAQNKNVTPMQRRAVLDALKKYLIIGIVCADISPVGAFKFYDEEDVFDSLSVAYITGNGKRISLKTSMQADGKTQMVIDSIKPIIRAALGKLGNNFHFFVCENKAGRNGTTISPYKPGAIEITFDKIGKNTGGTGKIEFPLNCLFVPRKCSECSKESHISWKYCPWCGAKHEK